MSRLVLSVPQPSDGITINHGELREHALALLHACLPASASDGDHDCSCKGFQNRRQRRREGSRSPGRIDESRLME